jgi:hypothetical protein
LATRPGAFGHGLRLLGLVPIEEALGAVEYVQGFQVRLRQEIAVAPAPRSNAHFRECSGIARPCLTNDEFVSHEEQSSPRDPLGARQSLPA